MTSWRLIVGNVAFYGGLAGICGTLYLATMTDWELALWKCAFKRGKWIAGLLAYWAGCCLLVPAIMLMFEWRNVGPALLVVSGLRRKTWGKTIEAAEVNTHLV